MNAKRLSLILVKVLLLTVVLMVVNGLGSRFLPTTQAAPAASGAATTSPSSA